MTPECGFFPLDTRGLSTAPGHDNDSQGLGIPVGAPAGSGPAPCVFSTGSVSASAFPPAPSLRGLTTQLFIFSQHSLQQNLEALEFIMGQATYYFRRKWLQF